MSIYFSLVDCWLLSQGPVPVGDGQRPAKEPQPTRRASDVHEAAVAPTFGVVLDLEVGGRVVQGFERVLQEHNVTVDKQDVVPQLHNRHTDLRLD